MGDTASEIFPPSSWPGAPGLLHQALAGGRCARVIPPFISALPMICWWITTVFRARHHEICLSAAPESIAQ
jgi:hypothetical protein